MPLSFSKIWNPNPAIQALALSQLCWLPKPCHKRSALGFTLSELLIAVLIMGVIATFTIPKVVKAQQDTRNNAIAKEAAASVAEAYRAYQLAHPTRGTATTFDDLTPYLSYVKVDTVTLWDNVPGYPGENCASFQPCLRLHNGALLVYTPGCSFQNTASTSAIGFLVDPDGKASNVAGATFYLYYNGRLTDWGSFTPNTFDCNGGPWTSGGPSDNPTYLKW